MSDDRIAEIRARHEDNASIGSIIHGPHLTPTWTLVGWKAHHDRAFLLLELDRVSAENERLRAENVRLRADVPVYSSDIQKLLAENDRHRKELEKLKIERDRARGELNLLTRDLPALPHQTAAGCVCPAGANLSCQNSFCPRRTPPGVTCQGGKP